ncbi:MAG: hypothetical protein AAB847_00385 [Patescibacteria group bacterium]
MTIHPESSPITHEMLISLIISQKIDHRLYALIHTLEVYECQNFNLELVVKLTQTERYHITEMTVIASCLGEHIEVWRCPLQPERMGGAEIDQAVRDIIKSVFQRLKEYINRQCSWMLKLNLNHGKVNAAQP